MDSGIAGSTIQSITSVAIWLVGGLATVIGVLILARLKSIEDQIKELVENQSSIKETQGRYDERLKSLFKSRDRIYRKLGWNGDGS